MSWSYPIGRLFGSEIRIHATFLLLLLWIGASAWSSGGAANAVLNVLFVISLFACVLAHEFGHALVARRYGIKTPEITMLPIGGVAYLDGMPDNPRHEIAVAVAGPMVNVVIWGVLTLVLGLSPDIPRVESLAGAAGDFAQQLAAVNLLLVLFNLIPAFPMDGGRVFRALLSIPFDRASATRIAAGTGQVMAVGFGLWGLLSGNLILILIAFFVFVAAQTESGQARMQSAAEGFAARDAMITNFEPLSPDASLMAMSASLLRTAQREFPVLDADHQILGFVTRDMIYRASQGGKPGTAAEIMDSDVDSVLLTTPLATVMDALGDADLAAVAVTDPGGRFLGYINRENIGELMMLRRRARTGWE